MRATEIPAPVQRYLDADADGNDEQLAQCFTADAKVRDEGRTIQGIDAIRTWKQDSRQKCRYTVEPLAVLQDGENAKLTARVTGTFPGSPVELSYRFLLRDGRIAELEIR